MKYYTGGLNFLESETKEHNNFFMEKSLNTVLLRAGN
jgi:hypothetical protein